MSKNSSISYSLQDSEVNVLLLLFIGAIGFTPSCLSRIPADLIENRGQEDTEKSAENSVAQSTDETSKPVRIQDNSFLLEEAYNQEAGVVQHIQTFQYMRNKTWSYTFTQEWPVPNQTHQLSYTIPLLRPDESDDAAGIGDIILNYRYQALAKDHVAFAPRLSLILPTGNEKKGTGMGAIGIQTNMPLSIELFDRWVTHWNAGLTFFPDAKEAGGAKAGTWGYNLGASVIWNAARNVDLMLESIWISNESVEAGGSTKWSDAFFVSPGVRFAINHKSGLQIVPGIAAPIGLGPGENEAGLFLYFSLEHPFMRSGR